MRTLRDIWNTNCSGYSFIKFSPAIYCAGYFYTKIAVLRFILYPVPNGAGFPLSSDGLLPLIRRAIGFFGIIHVFSFSIRRSRHNGWDRRYFSRNLQGGPVVPFGEVATLFIHVFPFLSGGGVTPPRPRYFCFLIYLPYPLYAIRFAQYAPRMTHDENYPLYATRYTLFLISIKHAWCF
jgi:hypothetical protein